MPTEHQNWDLPAIGDSGTTYHTKIETIFEQLDPELIKRGTRAEREAYENPEVNLVWLETDNLDTTPFWYYDGVQWDELSIGAGADTTTENTWTADQSFADDISIVFGTSADFGVEYDSVENELHVVATPQGTPTELFSIDPTGNVATTGNLTAASGAVSGDTVAVDGNTIAQSRPVSGQVTLAGGTAVVDTGISAVDATFMLALGVDDPAADVKVAGSLFWDDSAGSYWIEINETTTNVGTPTVNYDVIRVR